MTARTHDMFATATLVTLGVYFPPQILTLATFFACLIGCIVGSLVPDMDQATNRLWDLFPGGDYTGKFFKKLFLGHRSLSHSLLGLYLFYVLLNLILPKIFNPQFIDPQIVQYSLMIGFISHLIADGFTTEGLPLFFPLKIKLGIPPISVLRIKTGSWVENLIIFPGTIIYLFIFSYFHQSQLITIFKLLSPTT
jgi:inner membrane protein